MEFQKGYTMNNSNFADYVHMFLLKYLPLQRGLSKNTISSYSYAIMLFYNFCKFDRNIRPDKLIFSKIDKSMVNDFCIWLEKEKHNSSSTRNQRLAAIHSLFLYIQSEATEQTALCRDILEIPIKKTALSPPTYLTVEETKLLFSMPNIYIEKGRRHLTILLLLYDTGARAQELIDLCKGDIIFANETTVKLFGKGRKTRIIPIMPETAKILKGYIKESNIRQVDQPIFVNRSNVKLTNMGITYILKKYVGMAKKTNPDLFKIPVSPHMMRRTKGSHLIQNGVNIYYIRDFLGHSSIVTTERYIRNNPEVIRKAIERASEHLNPSNFYDKEKKQTMITFLKSLQ
jgi:integrase/recombinase XerD